MVMDLDYPSQPPLPLLGPRKPTVSHVCICEHNLEGDRDGCRDGYRIDSPS